MAILPPTAVPVAHHRPGRPGDLLELEELTVKERAYVCARVGEGERQAVEVPLGWGESAVYFPPA